MGYSPEQIRDLEEKIDTALNGGRLNAWQSKFLSDMRARFERYGSKTRLTDKQTNKLYEIIGSPRVMGKPLPRRPHVVAGSKRPRRQPGRSKQRRKGSVIEREARWFVRKMVRNLVIFAVLMAGVGAYSIFQDNPVSFTSGQSSTKPVSNYQFTVTDGDTVRVRGDAKGTRLVGFNTPETYKPQCARELELGKRATARLNELVATSNMDLVKVPCACKPGTEGTKACNYGRSCGVLRADGRDVGRILISEGLAVPFVCGATRCPRTPRPWCK